MITSAFPLFHRMQVTARSFFSLQRVSWRETLVLMVVAWLVPFLVHLVPWSGPRPLGVHLLPAFWTAFVAVYLYGGGIGLLVALVVPAVNLLTTGLPAWERVAPMMLELAAFVGIAMWLVRRWPAAFFVAPIAWLLARVVTLGVQWAVPVLHYTLNPVEHFLSSAQSSLAGIGVLLVINFVLVRLLPKDAQWDAE